MSQIQIVLVIIVKSYKFSIMKKIFCLFSLVIISFTGYSSSNPILDFVIFDNEKIKVSIANTDDNENRVSVKLYEDILSFKTLDKIKHIHIYSNEGILLYQIPIFSKKLEISKKLFGNGIYNVNFYFYENKKSLTTQVKIND